jgi:ABC-2 type transport system ATP-binding protein
LIRFQDVAKNYGSVNALDGVSFEVPAGEVFGYIGPNGAGKTTTLKIVTGLVRSFSGSVHVGGFDVNSNREGAMEITGYVPQDAGFQEWRTVEHALLTFASLTGIRGSDLETRVTSVLATLGITEFRKRKIIHLSGGTIQKLRIAQALLHNPQVLILDEPLSGLDPASRYDVKQIIKDLSAEGKTVLLSSHILNDIEGIANRIGILHGGRMMRIGTPEELRDEFNIGLAVDIGTETPEKAALSLEGIRGIQQIEVMGEGHLRVSYGKGVDLDREVNLVLKNLLAKDMPVRSLVRVQPSLEDVYMSYTGGAGDGR